MSLEDDRPSRQNNPMPPHLRFDPGPSFRDGWAWIARLVIRGDEARVTKRARSGGTVTLAILGGGLLLAGCSTVPRVPSPPAALPRVETIPVPRRVERPAPVEITWPVKRLRNADFVNLRDVASILAVDVARSDPGRLLELRDVHGRRFAFESGQDEFRLDGLRVFLGERIIVSSGTLWVSKLDLIKSVLPLLQPGAHPLRSRPAGPRTIVLDAGHGGIDPGTENRRLNLKEKTLTLDVALRVRQILEQRGWSVVMTRVDDRELSSDKKTDLRMRDDRATQSRADLFLSIHFNHADPRVSGVETYTMAPICVAVDITTANPVLIQITKASLTASGTTGDALNYICVGRK